MAFWSKKRMADSLIKYLTEQNVTYTETLDCISFELFFLESGYSVYPYIRLNEEKDELAIVINLRKLEAEPSLKQLQRINAFNLKSKYFTAGITDGLVLYLEYNAHSSYDTVDKIADKCIESLFNLQEEMDNL